MTELPHETADNLPRGPKILRRLLMRQTDLIPRRSRRLREQKFCKAAVCGRKDHLLELPQHFRETHNGIFICACAEFDVGIKNVAQLFRI